MTIFYTEIFSKTLGRLPAGIKRIFIKQQALFVKNWRDARLHTKKLSGMDLFSFRVTRNYRVLFKFSERDSVFFVSIGHRKNIYD